MHQQRLNLGILYLEFKMQNKMFLRASTAPTKAKRCKLVSARGNSNFSRAHVLFITSVRSYRKGSARLAFAVFEGVFGSTNESKANKHFASGERREPPTAKECNLNLPLAPLHLISLAQSWL